MKGSVLMMGPFYRYAKYLFCSKKECFILLGLCCLTAIFAYLGDSWTKNPILAWVRMLSMIVLRLTERMVAMYKRIDADK